MLGARDGERIVLFASECGAEMAEWGLDVAHDEFACLDRLIRLMRRGAADLGPVRIVGDCALVVIRPHPKDRPGKYDAYAQAGPAPRVLVDAGGDGIEAVLTADAVVGMDSSLLYEAEALGKPAISLLPGHRLAPAFVADLEPGPRQR